MIVQCNVSRIGMDHDDHLRPCFPFRNIVGDELEVKKCRGKIALKLKGTDAMHGSDLL
ncbi:hypothetical protein D3C71_2203860 [compost metagenome]